MNTTARKRLSRIVQHLKMPVLMVLLGIIVWGVLDQIQTRKLRTIFEEDLSQKLVRRNQEERIQFDNYAGAHSQAAKIVVSLRNFHEYVDAKNRSPQRSTEIKFHTDLPPWMPNAAIMRKFAYINYALLIDSRGRVREIYKGQPDPPPPSLIHPSELIQRLSHNQSFMTDVDGFPFLLTSESFADPKGSVIATLMLAARLDDEFLVNSQKAAAMEGEIVALVGGEEPRIVASSRPDILLSGTKSSDVRNDYLVTGKSFFDWGASDLTLSFTTLMSKQQFRKINDAIVTAERLQRAVIALAFIVSYVLIMYVITRQRLHYEDKLKKSNEELEQFAYVASHDLQEPLRKISSFSELLALQYKGRLDDDADRYLEYVIDGAYRMQTQIRELLEYSRIDRRGKEFILTDCNEVLNNTLTYIRLAIEEAGAMVTHDPLPIVNADGVQLGQVFQNLITNAVKFRGESPPQVHISAAQREKEWIFAVKDNGIGIAPEYAERIFVMFQRLHTRTEYPGTGLGLAICKKIVERHKGRIWVESEPGKGATFYFTVPA